MLLQMTSGQRRQANKLIQDMCINYEDGECVILGCVCPQMISYSVLCRYFRQAVLPYNAVLEADIRKINAPFLCKGCGNPIIRTGNKKQYCSQCARERYLRAKAKYERKVRCRRGKIER